MKQLVVLLAVIVIAAWCVWSVWSAIVAVKWAVTGVWRRPRWWVHVTSALFFADVLVWLRGALSGGLNTEKICRFAHHTVYDPSYRERHGDGLWNVFPLHNHCNAQYDLVPAWVNPTVGVLTVCTVVALCGAVRSVTVRRKRHEEAH
ncbi:hypothetical protein A6A06_09015 [Streptomyces sp. CB02923]|uniref:hypothetical protein n=1 Tax=Streptomyces sp. CB02923 TaxID=1718985 RepID=UPI00095980E4|nr:hypothetical protein [Streptomyces sp. CB02923]OKI04844.1 hypothetical protein A6A06_09015 [Streptomyces sp. CB02923]